MAGGKLEWTARVHRRPHRARTGRPARTARGNKQLKQQIPYLQADKTPALRYANYNFQN